jgi:predicted kinase
MEKTLFILRGLPGSGKSTLAKTLGGNHYEADMYFINASGKYEFDASKIKEAHGWCRDQVWMDMIKDEPLIVVSNTFTQEWEMKPYLDLAKGYGYKTYCLIVENRHEGINEHGVPEGKIEQMKNRFELKL